MGHRRETITCDVCLLLLGAAWAACAGEGSTANEVIKPGVEHDAATGTFSGAVMLEGDLPTPRTPMATPWKAIVADESILVDEKTRGVANAIVYLQRTPAGVKISDRPEDKVKFEVKGGRFAQRAIVVRAGQPLEISNLEPVPVNIHTFPLKNPGANFAVQVQGKAELTVQKAEKLPMRVGNDFHPWMVAYVLVVDHPWAVVTDAEGTFKIDGLPPGEYEFVVWHERLGYLDRKLKISIVAGETVVRVVEYSEKKLP